MRLIDVDAWWEEAQKLYTDGDCADADRYKVGINVGITASRGVMYHLPSIDIVRCGECKKSHIDGKTTHYLWCTEWGRSTDTFGYCERGEREGE